MLTLVEDPDSAPGSVLHINALADRCAGTLVGHAPPPQAAAQLPQDLLRALGHNHSAADWPHTETPAWRLARAWMAGFEITHLIVYGAWRIPDGLAERLACISAEDDLRITLVGIEPMRNRLCDTLAGLEARTISEIVAAPSNRTPLRPCSRRLPEGLPPLPAVGVTSFRRECRRVIEDTLLAHQLDVAITRRVELLSPRVEATHNAEGILGLLEEQIREAPADANGLLVAVRTLQISALRAGWLVRVPLHDVGLATVMALNTAPDAHARWPLPGRVRPRDQALAAAALATHRGAAELARLRLADTHRTGASLAGHVVPRPLRPPLRAHLHTIRHRPSDAPLFATASGGPMSASVILSAIDRVAPQAANSAHLGRDTLRRTLENLVDVVDLRQADSQDAVATSVLPSARSFGGWVADQGGPGALEHTGLPVHRPLSLRAGQRQAVADAMGYELPGAQPSRRAPRRNVGHDAQELHSVMLSVAGRADRGRLLDALDWPAERLHRAERQLACTLHGTAELLASTLDGQLELRMQRHPDTDRAVTKLAAREPTRELTAAAAKLLAGLLDYERHGREDLPPEDQRRLAAAQQELADLGLLAAGSGPPRLTDDARADLDCVERPWPIPGLDAHRVGVFADTHADARATASLIAAVRREGIQRIWCLGDFCSGGPDPVDTYEMTLDACEAVVIGNHELFVTDQIWTSTHAPWAVAAYDAAEALGQQRIDRLRTLPRELRLPEGQLVHGALSDRDRAHHFIADPAIADANLRLLDTPLLCFGHTHEPACWTPTADTAELQPIDTDTPIALSGPRLINPGAGCDSDGARWLQLEFSSTGTSATWRQTDVPGHGGLPHVR